MSLKEKVNAEQWKAIFSAPTAASTFVSTASGGGLEMIKESLSASKFIIEVAGKSGGSGYGSLVDDLLADLKSMKAKEAKENGVKYQAKDMESLRAEAKKIVAEGAAAVAELEGGDGFKRWIVDMARKVAETKTGGVLGIGGSAVIDEKEQAAIDELAELLGV